MKMYRKVMSLKYTERYHRMTKEQYQKNLFPPKNMVDVLLDTDAYNEIDDQFAIAYLLQTAEQVTLKGICAAPFLNSRSVSAADGMEKSYQEILKLLTLAGREDIKAQVYRGSEHFMKNETDPVPSDAADHIAALANEYSPEHPLYIIAIGAITNVASAILKNPAIKENCVVIWLGGHAAHINQPAYEFNMRQDIAAARIVFGSGVPMVQLPCGGVVDHLSAAKFELAYWLKGKNPLADYLYHQTVEEAEAASPYPAWSRIIWDVSAVAWLIRGERCWMRDKLVPAPIPEYDGSYSVDANRHLISYVNWISRDAIFSDLFGKLGSK